MSEGGAGFRLQWWDAVLVVVIVFGWVYVLFGPAPDRREAIVLPEVAVVVEDDGRAAARIDPDAWREACRGSRLPEPPDLNGADPVPVRTLFKAVQAWADRRDPAVLADIGRIYQALEKHEAALRCFAAASALDPANAMTRYLLGAQCQTLGLAEAAIDAFEKAADEEEPYAITYARLGLLYLERGDLERARINYDACRQLRPNLSLGYVGLGRVALAEGDAQQARQWLEQAVRATPNDYLAHRFLGRALAAAGDAEGAARAAAQSEALPKYSGWLTFDPRLNESHRLANTQRHLENEARLALGAGEFSRLLEIFEALAKRRPQDPEILNNLAGTYRSLQRLDEAETLALRAIKLNPRKAAFHCTRAEILFARDDYETMDKVLEVALALDPDNDRAWDLRGRARFFQGRHEEAFAALRTAIDLKPPSPGRRLILAEMYLRIDRPRDAADVLTELLAIDPDNALARSKLEQVNQQLGRD